MATRGYRLGVRRLRRGAGATRDASAEALCCALRVRTTSGRRAATPRPSGPPRRRRRRRGSRRAPRRRGPRGRPRAASCWQPPTCRCPGTGSPSWSSRRGRWGPRRGSRTGSGGGRQEGGRGSASDGGVRASARAQRARARIEACSWRTLWMSQPTRPKRATLSSSDATTPHASRRRPDDGADGDTWPFNRGAA